MVSKSRAQKQKKAAKIAEGNTAPRVADEKKSIHLKKVRPKLQHKHKIRLGMTSADIYEGFEDRKGVDWKCPSCGHVGRTVNFCIKCVSKQQSNKQETNPFAETAKKTAGKKKKMK